MCGIVGIIQNSKELLDHDEMRKCLWAMANSITHRGPDFGDILIDSKLHVGLGHRRLSIVDLSEAGNQPMYSHSKRTYIVFNGEIYNAQEVRSKVEHSRGKQLWKGTSDTEIILEALEQFGVETALEMINGMFAFAFVNTHDDSLYLVRDRFGEKPMYYGNAAGSLIFSSDITSFKHYNAWNSVLDLEALGEYFRGGYIPSPLTVFKNARKLEPGHYIKVSLPHDFADNLPQPRPYWSPKKLLEKCRRNVLSISKTEALHEGNKLLEKIVSSRMVSDVPLGAFLSGGIDSTTVVAYMQASSAVPIKTFCVSLENKELSEGYFAAKIAKHLGTDHHDFRLTPKEAIQSIPLMPGVYSEPFGDSSQIPTYLLSQFARKHVTVALTGDGGDEVFSGYNRHVWIPRLWSGAGWIPRRIRGEASNLVTKLSPDQWDLLVHRLVPSSLRAKLPKTPGFKIHKLAKILEAGSPDEMYRKITTHWSQSDDDAANFKISESALHSDLATEIALQDILFYLPDDILVKVDRASMAHSLETRAPFLDPELLEFSWKLPSKMRVYSGRGKWLLRENLIDRVPRELFERPKAGFGFPIAEWLRGPLREWAENFLAPSRLRKFEFPRQAEVTMKWSEHLSGRRDWSHQLWCVIMFHAWLDEHSGGHP